MQKTIDLSRITDITTRLVRISKEKWECTVCDDGMVMVNTPGDVICVPEPNHTVGEDMDKDNFEFIAHAPEDIAYLVSVIRELLG